MTTSQTAFLSEILSEQKIPQGKLAYFQDRLRNQMYDLVLREFLSRQARDPSFTQVKLAARLGKRPEQINRWLSGSGNWTLDTISNLLLAISASELRPEITALEDLITAPKANEHSVL